MVFRNFEQRKALMALIDEMHDKRWAEIDALSDDLSDEECDAAIAEIESRYDTTSLARKMLALEYKECRNPWFAEFVKSFGICESRRITYKQGCVFQKYSEPRHDYTGNRGMEYFVRVGNLVVKTVLFTSHEPAYVTIREI